MNWRRHNLVPGQFARHAYASDRRAQRAPFALHQHLPARLEGGSQLGQGHFLVKGSQAELLQDRRPKAITTPSNTNSSVTAAKLHLIMVKPVANQARGAGVAG